MGSEFTHGAIIWWILGIMVMAVGAIIAAQSGMIKSMVLRRHDAMEKTIEENHKAVQTSIQKGFEDVHTELEALKGDVSGVRDELHGVDKRLAIIETEHRILMQGPVPSGHQHCRHDDVREGE